MAAIDRCGRRWRCVAIVAVGAFSVGTLHVEAQQGVVDALKKKVDKVGAAARAHVASMAAADKTLVDEFTRAHEEYLADLQAAASAARKAGNSDEAARIERLLAEGKEKGMQATGAHFAVVNRMHNLEEEVRKLRMSPNVVVFWQDKRLTRILFPSGVLGGRLIAEEFRALCTWRMQGDKTMVFELPDENAPGGKWIDTLTLSPDKRSYRGKNQAGASLSGEVIYGRFPFDTE